MKLYEFLKKDYNRDELFEMANVATKRTNLSRVVWISSKMGSHSARIKVSNKTGKFNLNDNFSVSISDNPDIVAGESKLNSNDLKEVFKWVKLNKRVLLDLWNEKYDDYTDAILDLKKI